MGGSSCKKGGRGAQSRTCSSSGQHGIRSSAGLTFADLLGFTYLDDAESLFPGALGAHRVLRHFHEGIAARPRIAAYLASPRRPAAVQYGPDGKIFPVS